MQTREAPSQQTSVKTSAAGILTAVWNVLMPNRSGSGDPNLQKLPYTPSVDGDRLIAIGTGSGDAALQRDGQDLAMLHYRSF